MDFSLPTLFVIPSTGSFVTTGDSSTLALGDYGVFSGGGKAAATLAADGKKGIQIIQGRSTEDMKRLGSKKSGLIKTDKILEWYKVDPKDGDTTTVVTLSGFNMKCDEHYNLTMRFSSFYLNATYAGGRVDSVSVDTPCCDCGADPCDTLTKDDVATVLQDLVDKANAKWSEQVTFALVDSGANSDVTDLSITITSKPLTSYQTYCTLFDPAILDQPFIFPYFYQGAENSQDPMIEARRCQDLVTVEVTSDPTFPYGKANDIKILEYQNYTYQSDWKHLSYDCPEYNQFFQSMVDGDDYTLYVIKYKNTENDTNVWASYVNTDQITMIAIPDDNTTGGALETALETVLGIDAPEEYPGA